VLFEERCHSVAIGEIELDEANQIGFSQVHAPRFLERGIVVGIHVVEADNIAAVSGKAFCDVEPDEPGRSGDKNRPVSHWNRPASGYLALGPAPTLFPQVLSRGRSAVAPHDESRAWRL